jgi:hypothetical protein
MAELPQKEQLALHEFSVRYRAALTKESSTSEQSLDTVRDAVREQYEQERADQRSQPIEPPSPDKGREPDAPEA